MPRSSRGVTWMEPPLGHVNHELSQNGNTFVINDLAMRPHADTCGRNPNPSRAYPASRSSAASSASAAASQSASARSCAATISPRLACSASILAAGPR